MKIFVVTLALLAVVQCAVIQDSETVLRSVIANFVNCGNSDLSLCMKEKALLVTERFGTLRQLKVFDGLTIINNEPHKEGRSLEPLSDDAKVRNAQINQILSERAARLMENVDLEVSFGVDDTEDESSIGEARDGSKKKKKHLKKKMKMLLPLFKILKAKVMLILLVVALISAAALVKLATLAKIAFLVKAFLIIKALILKHKHGSESWVTHEEIDHHGHHGGWDGGHGGWEGGNGWGRAGKDANNLAYSAYQQNKI